MVSRQFIILFCIVFIHGILIFIISRVLFCGNNFGNSCLNSLYFQQIQLKAGRDRMGVSNTLIGKEAQFAGRIRCSRRGCLARGRG